MELGWSVHGGRALTSSGRSDRYEPGGRQWGPEGLFMHGGVPATLSTRKKSQPLRKRGWQSKGATGALSCQTLEQVSRTMLRSWCKLFDRGNRGTALFYGRTNTGEANRSTMELLDTQGSLWTLHIPRLLGLKEICWKDDVGTRQL